MSRSQKLAPATLATIGRTRQCKLSWTSSKRHKVSHLSLLQACSRSTRTNRLSSGTTLVAQWYSHSPMSSPWSHLQISSKMVIRVLHLRTDNLLTQIINLRSHPSPTTQLWSGQDLNSNPNQRELTMTSLMIWWKMTQLEALTETKESIKMKQTN